MKHSLWGRLLTLGLLLLLVAALTLFLQSRYSLYTVAGPSMEPTFHSGQTLLLEKTPTLQRGAVVVFTKPEKWLTMESENELVIKRVYGTPGDTIQLKNRVLTVNGASTLPLPEGYSCNLTSYSYTLKDHEYFVVGDNASHSLDSRKVLCGSKPQDSVVEEKLVVDYGQVKVKF